MNNIAVHMRISGVSVTDSDVDSRRNAAINLSKTWKKENHTTKIVSKAESVAIALGGEEGSLPSSLGEEIQTAIQIKSPSFLYEERPLDVSVCSGMAMVQILTESAVGTGWTIPDVYATALWLALSYQPPLGAQRRENLRSEVLTAATDYYSESTEAARERREVPDPGDLNITVGEEDVVTHNFKEVMLKTIEVLRSNAVLDREELDFLWWVQLGRSRLLKKQLSKLKEPTRIIAAGIEGATILRRLPCENHRELVLRTLDKDPLLDLKDLLAVIGEDRILLSQAIIKATVNLHPQVFPLLYALNTGEVDAVGGNIKRHVSEWGTRALVESSFARFMSQGMGKV